MEHLASKPSNGRWMGPVFSSALLCAIALFIPTFMVSAFAVANLRMDPATPWFLVPAILISAGTLSASEGWFARRVPNRPERTVRWLAMSVSISAGLAAITLVFMCGALHSKHVTLPGDDAPASVLFRTTKSFSMVLSAAIIEECAFRGALQLRLQNTLRSGWSEWIADLAFVLGHFVRFRDPGEIPLVVLLAFGNGRIAAVTQSVKYPALIHSLVNGLITGTVLLVRR